jgi:hypothetical protein
MQAFAPDVLQLRLGDDGQLVPDGWDPSDITITIAPTARCRACSGLVDNVREYKAEHVAWHQRLEPDAGIE